uniref:TPR_REGION domain-containing protein n=1 Tax=Gongylonema pulchrum TaxID=637853 RepID=A0A183ETE6_9BILA
LVDASDSRQLLDLHLEAEECVRFCFPYNHPAVAVHYRSIATFFLRCGQPHRAQLYSRKACEIFRHALGTEHPMTVECETLLKNTQREVEEAKKLIFGNTP